MTPLEIKVFLHHATSPRPYEHPSDAYDDAIRALVAAGLLTYTGADRDCDRQETTYHGLRETDGGLRLRKFLCSIEMRDPLEQIAEAIAAKQRGPVLPTGAAAAWDGEPRPFDHTKQKEHFLEPEEEPEGPKQGAVTVSISVGVGTHPQGGQSVLLIVSDDDESHNVDLPPPHARIVAKQLIATADAIEDEEDRANA
jgi:hypothetical protein